MSRRLDRNSESGFMMIEALVALALIAILLTSIGSLVATNSQGVRNLEQHVALIETTRLIAASLPRAAEPLPAALTGQVSDHRWEIRTSPFLDDLSMVPDSRFIPVRIELRVRSPSGATTTLETVRLQVKGGQ